MAKPTSYQLEPKLIHSLGFKLVVVITVTLSFIIMGIAKWVEIQQTKMIRGDAYNEAEALATTLRVGLHTLMLNGDGILVQEWLAGMQGIHRIKHIQIIRNTGEEAFRDLKTIESVNHYLEINRFHRNPQAFSDDFDALEHQKPTQTIKEGNLASYKDIKPGRVKLWMPIQNEVSCNSCHGYEKLPQRGFLHVDISTEDAEVQIAHVKQVLWLVAAGIALFLGLIIWWLLQYMVISPVKKLRRALVDLGDGKLQTRLPEFQKDEFGDVSRAFRTIESQWKDRGNRLSLLLNNVPDGIIEVDRQGTIQTVNMPTVTMFESEEEELIGSQILRYFGPVGNRESNIRFLSMGIKIVDLLNEANECLGFKKGGESFPVDLEVCQVKGKENVSEETYLFFIRDLTKTRCIEEEVRLLAAVVNQATEAILICNAQGIIEYVNPAFTKVTGFSAEEAINKNPSILKSGDKGQEYYQQMWESLLEGGVWQDLFVNKRKNGSIYQAEQHISSIRNNYGEITHFVSIQRDTTKEHALQEQMEHLQRLESLGVLAGGIAHDFNNILASVIGNVEIMAFDLPEDSPLHQYIQPINDASDRGTKLCLEMMAYAGKGQHIVEPVDLSEMVEGITRLLNTTISGQIKLENNLEKNLPSIMADITQIDQILMNLTINATEAIGTKQGHVVISTFVLHVDKSWFEGAIFGTDMEGGEYVCVTVDDDGCGMSRSIQNKIFEPFFTTKFTGRGLGMSAVLGIVQSHHGVIKCESTEGVGTTFTLLFPMAKLSVSHDSNRSTPVLPEFKAEGVVLIIDDEPSISTVLSQMLNKMGFSTFIVSDARDGLEYLTSQSAELVIVDMAMPYMDGLSFTKELRKSDQETPVIICSGDIDDNMVENLEKLVVNGFIHKPFRYEDIHVAVLKALKVV